LSYAADSDFNGRWLIQGKDGGPPRANWMEINGAGTPSASGWYVSAYAGDRNPIKDLAVKDGELRFSFERVNRDKTRKDLIVYRARLAGGKLEGSTEVEGSGRKTEWIAWRAPEISDRDDGSWVAGEIVPLFDGKSMEHWQPNEGWGIVEGVLRNQGKVRDLVTKDSFWNFRLQVDYRVMQRSNSGIGLRGRYEIQIIDDFGREPNTHTNGALYSRVPPPFNASKPAGEWQTYDIRLVGRQLTIDLNGKRIHDKVEIEGLTAIASNPFEDQSGPIVLQGDHGPVEFRRILLTNLVKK
jgi:hypothetical protein